MTNFDRPIPPLTADERTGLETWLEFHRATLASKCEGLTEKQLREASVPPSAMTLLGLVQHMAEIERNWFRRILTGEDVPPVHGTDPDMKDTDGGFRLSEDLSREEAFARWHAEIERAREICAVRSLEDTGQLPDIPGNLVSGPVNLRWIYNHMIEEYARHNGHADLIRERIDGRTGP
ncbi:MULTISPECIES: DinB family protein [Streptomyces]|uniref:DinB family protein n=1 Tax=Streptomyces lycii TaxID=2654337 RepID=A0ABQ7FLI5_9ACTN|nr:MULTISPECIES: DinB family protein [Streptomyces]KAF4408113.1 DinB family protein [Streptomyces lycii]PGH50711.1 Mini-circle protein [Streptomyces sp. Ru87]